MARVMVSCFLGYIPLVELFAVINTLHIIWGNGLLELRSELRSEPHRINSL